RPGLQCLRGHRQDRKRDLDFLAALLQAHLTHTAAHARRAAAVTDVLLAVPDYVAAPQSAVEQEVEPHALVCAERPPLLTLCDVVLIPWPEALPLLALRILD